MRNSLNIQSDIDDIDRGLMAIRNNPYITNNEKLKIIKKGFEKRNELYDELLQQRINDFKKFVDSLDLEYIDIKPYYPVPQRARLTLTDPYTTKLGESRKKGPLDRKIYEYFHKGKASGEQDELERLLYLESKMLSERKANYRQIIANLKKKAVLKNSEYAELARLEAELNEIRRSQYNVDA